MKHTRQIRIAPGREAIADWIERITEQQVPVMHTYCHKRNTVQWIRPDGMDVVVKRFKRPNLINSLVYTHLRPSKADRSFDNALRFERLGLPTPAPVAVITDCRGARLTDSWYISLHTDASPIADTVTEDDRPLMDSMFDSLPMLRQFVDFAVTLFSRGVYQRDFNRGNFLAVETQPGQWTFPMVDINRIQYGSVTPEMIAMAWVRFGCDTCPGLVERLTVECGLRLGLDENRCRREAQRAVKRGARIERRRQFKRTLRRTLRTLKSNR